MINNLNHRELAHICATHQTDKECWDHNCSSQGQNVMLETQSYCLPCFHTQTWEGNKQRLLQNGQEDEKSMNGETGLGKGIKVAIPHDGFESIQYSRP